MSKSRANTQIVRLEDGRKVLFSYGVAVAVYIPNFEPRNDGYYALDYTFSVTTSKHVNAFTNRSAVRVSAARFIELISPVSGNLPTIVLHSAV